MVIDEVVAPLLHNNDPVNEPAVNTVLPQLLTTVTEGAAGIELTVSVHGLEFTDPAEFVHTARYCLLLSAIVVENARVLLVAPLISLHVVPFVLCCQCTVGVGLPFAAEVKLTLAPAHFVCEVGSVLTIGNEVPPPVLNTTSTQ